MLDELGCGDVEQVTKGAGGRRGDGDHLEFDTAAALQAVTVQPVVLLGRAVCEPVFGERVLRTAGGDQVYRVERFRWGWFGFNWGEVNDNTFSPGLKDQKSLEAYYRFQLTEQFALTPDIQYIKDPPLNLTEDSLWIFGLRARLAL